jgi:hypothetical protein
MIEIEPVCTLRPSHFNIILDANPEIQTKVVVHQPTEIVGFYRRDNPQTIGVIEEILDHFIVIEC